ncbi:MAG: TRAP transporter small permease [Gammaproteobacteria bacterium]|nr:TRAP transporter small permease [Gammaproteobacteria bacterium]
MTRSPDASLVGRVTGLARACETGLLCAVLAAMVLLAAAQIVFRNLGWGGIAWADEALRLMVLWVAVLGAVAASRGQRHVSIDAFARLMQPAAWRAVQRLTAAFATVVCAALAWQSLLFVRESAAAGDLALGGAVPAWATQVILPVGFALMALRYAILVWSGPAVADNRQPAAH